MKLNFEKVSSHEKNKNTQKTTELRLVRDYETGDLGNREKMTKEELLKEFFDYYENNKILNNDAGMNAQIFELPREDNKTLVIKEMRQKKMSAFAQNPSSLELDIQNELYVDANIRTPMPVGIIEYIEKDFINKKITKKELIVMEKILGHSIGDHFRDKNNELEKPSIDINDFMTELEEEIEKMHKAGYYHKDLTMNNVIINSEGKPVIIDFGTTGSGDGEDPYAAPNHVVMIQGERKIQSSRYVSDEDNLVTIREALKKLF